MQINGYIKITNDGLQIRIKGLEQITDKELYDWALARLRPLNKIPKPNKG